MDSSFVNYDGRSVHDMLEILQAASGDPEAIARLQTSINAVDAKFGPVNTELARLETDKQDVGSYATFNGLTQTEMLLSTMSNYRMQIIGTNEDTSKSMMVLEPETGRILLYDKTAEESSVSLKATFTADYDSGNIQIAGEYMDFTVRRIGKVVWLTYASACKQAIPASQASQTDTVLATLPVGFRPLNNSAQVVCNNTADKTGLSLVTGNGNIVIRSASGFSNETVLVNNVFLTDQAIPTT